MSRWLVAWIDETSFYGKMNGLWTLNGSVSGLDFTLVDGVRPVNSLVVGEFGLSGWLDIKDQNILSFRMPYGSR